MAARSMSPPTTISIRAKFEGEAEEGEVQSRRHRQRRRHDDDRRPDVTVLAYFDRAQIGYRGAGGGDILVRVKTDAVA